VALNFFKWLVGKTATETSTGTAMDCSVFIELAQEYALRELAFESCVNMIANALGKCEFKTYKNNKEIEGREYYTWNVEPNPNQNSTVFLHKLVNRLYRDNEALVISSIGPGGAEYLNVADSFTQKHSYPVKQNIYENIVIGDKTYANTFIEQDALHLRLNNKDIKKVLDAMYSTYSKMISAAEKAFGYELGQHWKVHVANVQSGDATFQEQFQELMQNQIIPYMKSENGVLVEHDGYDWQNMATGSKSTTRDIRALYDDIFDFTARAFHIPTVLLSGEVAGTSDAFIRWLTLCIDPLCDQLQEEINRKRYGYSEFSKGNYLRIDTSTLIHFDMFAQANNIDKLVSSGVFTVNMILKAAGLPPIDEDWADKHFITKNYASIEEVLRLAGGGETK